MKEKCYFFILVGFIATLTLPAGVNAARPSLSGIQAQIDSLQDEIQQQQGQIDLLEKQLEPPIEIILPAVFRGKYDANGTAYVGSNIFVGALDYFGQSLEFRNFFVFDLSEVLSVLDLPQDFHDFLQLRIVSAELYIYNPLDGFLSTSSDTETYNLNRVGTPFDGMGDPVVFKLIGGEAGSEIFTDLADGPGYGSYVASTAQNNNTLVIGLSSQRAIHDLNRKVSGSTDGGPFPDPNSRLFAVGGSISTLYDVVDTEGLFGGSASGTAASLLLKVKIETLP